MGSAGRRGGNSEAVGIATPCASLEFRRTKVLGGSEVPRVLLEFMDFLGCAFHSSWASVEFAEGAPLDSPSKERSKP